MEQNNDNQQPTTENSEKRHLTLGSALVLLVVFFILAAGFFWWLNNCKLTLECKTTENISNLEISGDIIKKNETIAKLTAQVVKKQIDNMLVIGSVYAGRKELAQLIQQDKWQNAINMVSGILKEAPQNSIDRIGLLDKTGTLLINVPEDTEVRGQNFAFRDWYRGVTSDFKPYVSEVFERTAKPNFNVVILAFPIFNSKDVPIGFMTMQIKTDIFQKWISDIKFGTTGLSYIVDQRGRVVAHPHLATQAEIVDYSSRTEVQKVISGQSGTEISFGPKNQRVLASYEPLDFHWGVITRIELDEVINSGLMKDNSLGQIKDAAGGGIIRKIFEKVIPSRP